jgi:Flp pilus assembly protein TadG
MRSQRGATALIVALTLLLMMGMAAFAIDISAAKNERRLDQNGADASVMAGALQFALGGSAQSIIDEAKAFVATNVRPVSAADWTACTDPDALPILSTSIPGVVGTSPCISFQFAPDDSLIRVRVPNQRTNTTFGRVLGVTQVETFAAAEATIFETANGAFPAGVFAGTAAGAEVCIKTGTAGGRDSCGASTTGDFGNFNPYFYTELGSGPQSSFCRDGNQPGGLARAMADGLDHRLGTSPTSPGNRINGGDCPGFPGPLNPNQVDSGGGYSNLDVTNGLVAGSAWPGGGDSFSGRLTRTNVDPQFEIFNRSIDNKPLWEYIDTSQSLTGACQTAAALNPTTVPEFLAAEDTMQACLASQNSQLFDNSIGATMRLATVPKYHQASPLGSNACCYDIADFVPIFIQGLWTDYSVQQWTCTGVFVDAGGGFCMHEPGMQGEISVPAQGSQRVDSASALVLECEQLPAPLCQTISGGGSPGNEFFTIELTR